jgi:adenosine deaminase
MISRRKLLPATPIRAQHSQMRKRNRFFPLFSSYIYHLVNDPWALTYTTISVLRDFAQDGVVYLELRTTPRAMPRAGLTKAQYVKTILDAIASFEAETPTPPLRTRLILSVCMTCFSRSSRSPPFSPS